MLRAPSTGSSLLTIVAALALGGTGIWMAGRQVGSRGDEFYETGKLVVDALDHFARSAKLRDVRELTEHFSSGYKGQVLGLKTWQLTASRDGIQLYTSSSSLGATDRTAAVAEWDSYLRSFDAIETVEFHLHRMDE